MDTVRSYGLVRPGAIAVALAVLLTSLVAAPVWADGGLEMTFTDRVNLARRGQGLPLLRVADDLVAVARRHSQEMAATGSLRHNAELGTDVQGWLVVAENVGYGSSVEVIHNAFMASAAHRSNILRADVSEIGVGVVVANGGIWVTQVFRQSAGAAFQPPSSAVHETIAATAAAPTPARPTTARHEPGAPPIPGARPIGPADSGRILPASPPVEVGSLLADVMTRTAGA